MQNLRRTQLLALSTLSLAFGLSGCADVGASAYYENPSAGTRYAGDAAEQQVGDSYEDVGTNPYTDPAHDPFSTFAADVDSASYDIFVRDVGEYGALPDQASVRLEEYVNYFDYGYEAPASDSETPFSIELDLAAHPMGRDLAQLRVGIQAEQPPEFVKLPTNLVFLVDTSGSMSSSDKLPLVQRVLTESLELLDQNDTISIVTYAGSVGVVLASTPASDRATIERAIANFSAGGGTAGGAGIELAYQQAEAGFLEDGFNQVVICTDGDFNVGASSTEALVELIEEKRQSGVMLTALGFGRGNLNDAMMERVSNAGNGIYSVIASASHATRYVEERLLNNLHHVAQDMKLQVEFNPRYVAAYRLLGYENRALADDDFRVDSVDAGEVGAGHRVTALYEIVLTGGTMPTPEGALPFAAGEPVEGQREISAEELVTVRIRYKQPGASADDPALEVNASLGADITVADEGFRYASAVAALAEILHGSPYADPSELQTIGEILAAGADLDRDRAELYRLFLIARRILVAR